ncbi:MULTISPECIES: hypothetical protein [Prevotella]|nr:MULTISPECIES: hypothetical protein [Prevotella]
MIFRLSTTIRNTFFAIMLIIVMLNFVSCNHPGSEDSLTENADSFSCYYFNWQYQKALRYVTPESEKWLRFEASQVHQVDVDMLKSKDEGAACEIGEVTYLNDDSLATVKVDVKNYLAKDTIGADSHIVEKATFVLNMVYKNDKWLVKLNSIPRRLK